MTCAAEEAKRNEAREKLADAERESEEAYSRAVSAVYRVEHSCGKGAGGNQAACAAAQADLEIATQALEQAMSDLSVRLGELEQAQGEYSTCVSNCPKWHWYIPGL